MAIVVLPQKQPTQNQTGMGQFVQGMNPMLQAAFAQALQNKAYQFQLQKQMEMKQRQAEQDRQNTQKTLEQFGAYTKTPETQSFMQPSAEYPQGIQLPIPGKFKESYDLSKLPEGVKIGSGGDMSFQAPDPFSQYYKTLVAGITGKPTTDQSTGETPVIPGMGITGVSLGKGGGRINIGQTPEEKASTEISTASKKEAQIRANKLSELNKAIDFFEQKINEIPGSTGFGGRMKGLETTISGITQTNPKAAAYMANIEGLRSQIARGLGEVGNLSEYEQKFAAALLPGIGDNLETRKQKISNFRDYIKMRLGTSDTSKSTSGTTGSFNFSGMTTDQLLKRKQQLLGGGQ